MHHLVCVQVQSARPACDGTEGACQLRGESAHILNTWNRAESLSLASCVMRFYSLAACGRTESASHLCSEVSFTDRLFATRT